MKQQSKANRQQTQRNIVCRKLMTMLIIFCMVFSMAAPVLATETVQPEENIEAVEPAEIFGFSGEAGKAEEDEDSKESEEAEDTESSTKELTFIGSDYTVTAVFPADALPENVQLQVREIKENTLALWETAEYQDYLEQAKEVAREEDRAVSAARFFDITFITTDENNVTSEVEPTAPVGVRITYDQAETLTAGTEVQTVHLPDGKENTIIDSVVNADTTAETAATPADAQAAAPVAAQIAPAATGANGEELAVESISFTAAEFSVYGVMYTVDFWYGKYQFSIEGNSSIMVSELFEKLGIEDVTVADVKKVTFSDEGLVKIEKYGDNWKLTSLKPFDTEETLTIEMKNGQVIEVRVTDAQQTREENATYKVTTRPGNVNQVVTYWDTFEEAVAEAHKTSGRGYGAAYEVSIEVLDSVNTDNYVIHQPATFSKGANITINGNGHTLTCGSGLRGQTAVTHTSTSALVVNNLTIDGGTSGVTTIYNRTSNGATTFTDVTINAGNATGNLVTDSERGTLRFNGCTISGSTMENNNSLVVKSGSGVVNIFASTNNAKTTITGNKQKGILLNLAAASSVNMTSVDITGSSVPTDQYIITASSITANNVTVDGGTGVGGLVSMNGKSTFNDCEFDGGQLTGDLFVSSTNEQVTFNNGSITGSADTNGGSIIKRTFTGTGTTNLSGITIDGNKTKGNLIEFINAGTNRNAMGLSVSGGTIINMQNASGSFFYYHTISSPANHSKAWRKHHPE